MGGDERVVERVGIVGGSVVGLGRTFLLEIDIEVYGAMGLFRYFPGLVYGICTVYFDLFSLGLRGYRRSASRR